MTCKQELVICNYHFLLLIHIFPTVPSNLLFKFITNLNSVSLKFLSVHHPQAHDSLLNWCSLESMFYYFSRSIDSTINDFIIFWFPHTHFNLRTQSNLFALLAFIYDPLFMRFSRQEYWSGLPSCSVLPTRPFRTNTPKRCHFHYRGLECKSSKSKVMGKFGLGVQNEAGQRLTEFC